jgi:hypothetical protein
VLTFCFDKPQSPLHPQKGYHNWDYLALRHEKDFKLDFRNKTAIFPSLGIPRSAVPGAAARGGVSRNLIPVYHGSSAEGVAGISVTNQHFSNS